MTSVNCNLKSRLPNTNPAFFLTGPHTGIPAEDCDKVSYACSLGPQECEQQDELIVPRLPPNPGAHSTADIMATVCPCCNRVVHDLCHAKWGAVVEWGGQQTFVCNFCSCNCTSPNDAGDKTASTLPEKSTKDTDAGDKTASTRPEKSIKDTDAGDKTASTLPEKSTKDTDAGDKTASTRPEKSIKDTDAGDKTASTLPEKSTKAGKSAEKTHTPPSPKTSILQPPASPSPGQQKDTDVTPPGQRRSGRKATSVGDTTPFMKVGTRVKVHTTQL